MKIESTILKLENTGDFSVENIENQIARQGVVPLRWAIVEVDCKYLLVNTAYQVE